MGQVTHWPGQSDKCVLFRSDQDDYNTLYPVNDAHIRVPPAKSASEKIYEKFLKIDESRPRHKQ